MRTYDYKTRDQLEKLNWTSLQAELKRLDRHAGRIKRVLVESQDHGIAGWFDEAIDERAAWCKAIRLAQEVELDHEDDREERLALVGRRLCWPYGRSVGWNRYFCVGIGQQRGILIVQRRRVDGGLQATKERMHMASFIY